MFYDRDLCRCVRIEQKRNCAFSFNALATAEEQPQRLDSRHYDDCDWVISTSLSLSLSPRHCLCCLVDVWSSVHFSVCASLAAHCVVHIELRPAARGDEVEVVDGMFVCSCRPAFIILRE